ncbi:MAG: hypothetical protein ACK5LK_04960 [Chthoniobacterales bacterium]
MSLKNGFDGFKACCGIFVELADFGDDVLMASEGCSFGGVWFFDGEVAGVGGNLRAVEGLGVFAVGGGRRRDF